MILGGRANNKGGPCGLTMLPNQHSSRKDGGGCDGLACSGRSKRDLSAGRGLGAAAAVRPDSGADRPAAAGVCFGVRLAAPENWGRTSLPCVRGAPGGK